MKRRVLCYILTLLLALSMLTGCGKDTKNETQSAVVSQSVVTLARDLDSNNLDPVMTADNCNIWVINMMIEGLVASSDDGKDIIPAIADTWSVSEDGLQYQFHIRDDIQFSNGEKVTVEDCIYSLQRAKDTQGPWVGMLDMINSMEDTGNQNLTITLQAASPAFLSTLAMSSCGIMPKAYCEEQGGEGIARQPVGTGPFSLKEWKQGEKMIFTRNPYYWEKGCPKVDEIDMVVVKDDNTRVMQLQSGQIDIATQIPYSRINELKASKGIQVQLFDSTDVKFIIINCQSKYLTDKRVRQALKYATDKDAINQAVYFGNGEIAETFLSPSAPHYHKELPKTEVAIEKAKNLLEEAGYGNGFELTLEVGSGDTAYLQIATMLQEQWSRIGISLNIQQIDTATARQNWKDGNYDVYISYMTSDMTDTSELAGLWCIREQANCWRTYWNDEDQKMAEALCMKANAQMDEDVRMEDYGKMQEIVADAVPVIPLVYVPYTFVTTDKVSGAAQTPLGIYNFKNLEITR